MPIPTKEIEKVEPTKDETDAVRTFMEDHCDYAYTGEEVSEALGIHSVKKVIHILVRLQILEGVVDMDFEHSVFYWKKSVDDDVQKPVKDKKVDRFDKIL